MERIKDTIQSVIQDLAEKKKDPGRDDPHLWLQKTLTKRELEHIKLNYFKRGILGINVDSSSRLYDLNLQKEKLLSRLTSLSEAVKDIRFRLGEIK